MAAEEPNWRDVLASCIELMARTKDIRVATYLALGSLKVEGLPGLRDGLAVLAGILERYWDECFPALDPEDDYDPLERMNIIGSIDPQGGEDVLGFKGAIRESPLTNSRQLGRFSLRDVEIARGDRAWVGGESEVPPELPVIQAAFADTDTEELKVTAAAVTEAAQHVRGIDELVTARVGASRAPSLDGLVGVLGEVGKCLDGALAARGVSVSGVVDSGDPAVEESSEPGGSSAGGGAAGGATGEIRSKDDVVRALDRICVYYERTEPSSPVPVLLRHAQRLVPMTFLEVMRHLAPDAMGRVQLIGGLEEVAE